MLSEQRIAEKIRSYNPKMLAQHTEDILNHLLIDCECDVVYVDTFFLHDWHYTITSTINVYDDREYQQDIEVMNSILETIEYCIEEGVEHKVESMLADLGIDRTDEFDM